MSTIDGPALLGFSDFFSTDNVGAADRGYGSEIGAAKKPAAKAPAKAGPAGKYFKAYPKPARTQTVQSHGKVLKKSRNVATKAAKTIGVAMHLLSRKPAVASPAAKLHGRTVHVGADVAAKMTPKAKAAVAKHNAAVAKAKKASQVLAHHAVKTRDAVKTLAKKMVAQKKTSKFLRTPLKKRAVHVGELLADPIVGEQVAQMLGEYYESIGADPDPANPGYLTDGSPDPAAATAGPAPSDADLGLPAEDPVSAVVDSGADLPPPLAMSEPIVSMEQVGGIAYDGSKGRPNGYLGSYGLFTRDTEEDARGGKVAGSDSGRNYHGFVWGSFDQDQIPNGVPYGGRLKEDTWHLLHGRWVRSGEGNWSDDVSEAEAFASSQKTAPNGQKFGPLVGNPGMPDFKALRVDSQGNIFWLPQEAPDWVTFPIKQAAALTARAEAEADAAEKKAAAAAAAKIAADNAAAQAAQEAANALAESAAASTAKIAKGEEETKQAAETTKQQATETEAQQALVKQQAEDTTAQAVETQQTKEAGTLMLERNTNGPVKSRPTVALAHFWCTADPSGDIACICAAQMPCAIFATGRF